MKPDLTKFAIMPAPRYTSYPTAPQFSEIFGHETYDHWLSRLNPEQPVSLYLHVPFCKQLCWYCGCNMKLASREETLAKYAATLRREIALLASKLPDRMTLSHLHWGGGTPTALSPSDLDACMRTVRQCFDLTKDAEIAIESDPRTLSDKMIERIGELGFTRASFGVQEFDPKVQKAINRIQPPEMVSRAVNGLRSVGVKDINFDLIYGLPFQTSNSLVSTIEKCVEMKPNRFALFGYAHVPWMAKKQRLIPEEALPGASERLKQAEIAEKVMEQFGYNRIGLDHFALSDDPLAVAARDGTLRRNFQGYTTDDTNTLLGVGSTSIGKTQYGYVQNISETGAWARSVEAELLPIGRGRTFRGEDLIRGFIIEKLMCFGSVDLNEATGKFGYPKGWFTSEVEQLNSLADEGIVIISDSKITVAKEAKSVVRVVAAIFDEYFQTKTAKHSVAV